MVMGMAPERSLWTPALFKLMVQRPIKTPQIPGPLIKIIKEHDPEHWEAGRFSAGRDGILPFSSQVYDVGG